VYRIGLPAAACHKLLLLLLLGGLTAVPCVAELLRQRLALHGDEYGATSCLLLCCSKPWDRDSPRGSMSATTVKLC
jgi:hypothetical protein